MLGSPVQLRPCPPLERRHAPRLRLAKTRRHARSTTDTQPRPPLSCSTDRRGHGACATGLTIRSRRGTLWAWGSAFCSREAMNILVAFLCALALPALATAQNGRTMELSAPVVTGRTAAITLKHPDAAAGNGYWVLLTAPQHSVAQPLTIPGFTVNGLMRIDQFNFQDLFTGVLTATGAMTNSIGVPNEPLLVGFAFDLQSIDLALATNTLTFADNELSLEVSG